MTIIGFNGKVRCGKGVLLSLFSLADLEVNKEVLCNYPLEGGKQITPYDFCCLIEGEPNLEKKTISLQEVYGWLNSHKSMSNVSELEDNLVFQSGKLGYDVYYDTQVQMRALGSLRDMTDYRFECTKVGDTVADFESGYFEYFPLDVHNHEENIRVGDGFRIPFKIAALWWNRYDTLARTPILGYKNLIAAMVNVDPKIKMSFIDKQVSLLLLPENRRLWVKPDRVSVACALLELGESDVHASFVANRLQLRLSTSRGLGQKREILPLVRSDLLKNRWRR